MAALALGWLCASEHYGGPGTRDPHRAGHRPALAFDDRRCAKALGAAPDAGCLTTYARRSNTVLHRRDPGQGIACFYSLMIERHLFRTVRPGAELGQDRHQRAEIGGGLRQRGRGDAGGGRQVQAAGLSRPVLGEFRRRLLIERPAAETEAFTLDLRPPNASRLESS